MRTEEIPLTSQEWNIISTFVWWLLADANGNLTASSGAAGHLWLPKDPPTIYDMAALTQGWNAYFSGTQLSAISSQALMDASGSFAAAQNLAAATLVASPTAALITQITADLQVVSGLVKRDQNAQALSTLFADAAGAMQKAA